MKELIDEMSYDLAECHVDYLDDAKLYTDYDTMAQKMVSRGYRRQSKWISVDERLPKQWEKVLVFCDDIISTDFISSTGRWYEHIDHDSVTHWMPLPEPPKMKGGAE